MADPDFERFASQLNIQGRTSWCELPELGPGMALELLPANESNRDYHAAKVKASARRPRMGGSTGKQVLDMEPVLRREDVDLFPKHVVKNWRGMLNGKGEPVPFSPEKCRALFDSLPGWYFDRVRGYANVPENFLPDGEEAVDPAALSKN